MYFTPMLLFKMATKNFFFKLKFIRKLNNEFKNTSPFLYFTEVSYALKVPLLAVGEGEEEKALFVRVTITCKLGLGVL